MSNTIKDLDEILASLAKANEKTGDELSKGQIEYYVSEYGKINNKIKKLDAEIGGGQVYKLLAKSESLEGLSSYLGSLRTGCKRLISSKRGFSELAVKDITKKLGTYADKLKKQVDELTEEHSANESKKGPKLQLGKSKQGHTESLEEQMSKKIREFGEPPKYADLPEVSDISPKTKKCRELLNYYNTFKDYRTDGCFDEFLSEMFYNLEIYAKNEVFKAEVNFGTFSKFGYLKRNTHFKPSIVKIKNIIAGKKNEGKGADIKDLHEDDEEDKKNKSAKGERDVKVPEKTRKTFRKYCSKVDEIRTFMETFEIKNNDISNKLDKLFAKTFHPIFEDIDDLEKVVKFKESDARKIKDNTEALKKNWDELVAKTADLLALMLYDDDCIKYFSKYNEIFQAHKQYDTLMLDCKDLLNESEKFSEKIIRDLPKIKSKLKSVGPIMKKLIKWDDCMKNLKEIEAAMPDLLKRNERLTNAIRLAKTSAKYVDFGEILSGNITFVKKRLLDPMPFLLRIHDSMDFYRELKTLEKDVTETVKSLSTSVAKLKNISLDDTFPPFYPECDTMFSLKNLTESYVLFQDMNLVPKILERYVKKIKGGAKKLDRENYCLGKLQEAYENFVKSKDELKKYKDKLEDMKKFSYEGLLEYLKTAKVAIFILLGILLPFLAA